LVHDLVKDTLMLIRQTFRLFELELQLRVGERGWLGILTMKPVM
jgi:hypothetical protein